MKYIIILISFLIISCQDYVEYWQEVDSFYAQVPFVPIGMGESKTDTVEYVFTGKVNWIAKELTNAKIINRPITLNDYFDYAEECYNDSTWGHKNVISIIEPEYYVYRLDVDYINNGICYLRKEPTMKGFIEWLKK